MADSDPPEPVTYQSTTQSTPAKHSWKSADPRKHNEPLPPDAKLDRFLQLMDSMGKTVLIPQDGLIAIMRSGESGPAPQPPQEAIETARASFDKLFFSEETGERKTGVTEDAIVQATIGVLNSIGLPNGLVASPSQYKYDLTDDKRAKVDAALYPADYVPNDARPNWTHLRMFVEFKKGGTGNDPFDDDGPIEAPAQTRTETRGQLTAYAYQTLVYQHRTAVYAMLINGSDFRGMRWDYSGLLVTPAKDFSLDPTALLQFFWAFSSLDEVGQGLDPTATLVLPGSAEYKRMDLWAKENSALDMPCEEGADLTGFFDPRPDEAEGHPSTRSRRKADGPTQPVFKYIRDDFRKSISSKWPRYKLKVGPEGREFLVGKPIFTASSVFGRGTRGHIGLDVVEDRFVFLKDSWRPFYKGVDPEGAYLEEMASKPDVSLVVPTVVAHGDVLKQRARSGHAQDDTAASVKVDEPTKVGSKRTHDEVEDDTPEDPESSSPTLRQLIHYRIVVNEVCLKMSNFRNGEHLVKLIEDCVITHRDAYVHFGLLHRDISAGNMMILPRIEEQDGKKRVTWRGVLIDWELAKYVPKDDSAQSARQPERTGTWQFMSVAYVLHPDRPIKIADELESFLHVLIYYGVRYLRHTLEQRATEFIVNYFDTFILEPDRQPVCSYPKAHAVKMGVIDFGGANKKLRFLGLARGATTHPLNSMIFADLLPLFTKRYSIVEWEDSVEDLEKKRKAQRSDNDDVAYQLLMGEPPSEECRNEAAKLDTHDEFLRILKTRLGEAWPDNDKTEDQLSPEYDPRRLVVATMSTLSSLTAVSDSSSSSAAKKSRVNHKAKSSLLVGPKTPHAARPVRPPRKTRRRK
ncbi:hypothetical protein BD413DRAFT_687778 [Trametes elegans]|nr:hypothetical protein BD413DRAFT_687778 [Trametes elegans]